MRMRELSKGSRPRERMQQDGASALSEAELIAAILQNGTRKESILEVSNRLIAKYGTEKLPTLSLRELQTIEGIGPAKAMQLIALFELSKRCTGNGIAGRQITSAQDVYDYVSSRLQKNDREQFIALLLDTKNRILKCETVSIGTLDASIVHPREIFKSAIKESASAVIIAHNHPSGDPTPSRQDEEATKQLKEAGILLGMEVLDHVIIGKESYYSFAEHSEAFH